jgi:hypothetical protein
MPRRKQTEDDGIVEPAVTAYKPVVEIRGRGKNFKIHYSDESGIPSPVAVYDREGDLKEILYVGSGTGKMTESSFTGTLEECEQYVSEGFVGFEVKIIKYDKATADRLEKAAATRAKNAKEKHD